MPRWIALLVTMAIVLTTFAVSGHCDQISNAPNTSGLSDDPKALNAKVLTLFQAGRYAEAIPLAQRALAIWENDLGPEHPFVSTGLNNLAGLYKTMGELAKAEPLLLRALAIREKVRGPEHSDVATSLNNLAALYDDMGAYSKAETFYTRALAILEKVKGPEHADTAACRNNLAKLYDNMGAYAKAEPLYMHALGVWVKLKGPEHPNVAACLNNLAELYLAMGDFAKAEPFYTRALAIREKTLESNHPDIAQSLNNLAGFYYAIGDRSKAEPLYARALAIQEKSLGLEHLNVATTLNNIALLYKDMNDFAKAEPLYARALAIKEKKLGPEHATVATSLNNLASLYYTMGEFSKAEPLYLRALAIDEKVLGNDHPDLAKDLNNLAALYRDLDDYAKADSLYTRALSIATKAQGPEHPALALMLINFSASLAARADYRQAFALQRRAQDIHQGMIDQVMGFTSEEQKLEFLGKLRGELQAFFTLAGLHLREDAQVARSAFDVWLRRKGAALEAQRQFQEALLLSGDSKGKEVFAQLALQRAKFSRLVFAGPGKESPEAYRARMDALKKALGEKEAELSRLSQPFARSKKRAAADATQAAAALPKGAALLELAKIDVFDFKATGKESKWRPARYLAFVLPAGAPERLAFLDLGEAAPIDAAVAAFKRATEGASDPAAATQAARTLHDLVFAPLVAGLGKATDIFLSPDGDLNLIPFEALLDAQGRRLIETYTFNYLATGRDLIGMGETAAATGPSLVIGDPDYELGGAALEASRAQVAGLRGEERSFLRSADLRGMQFNPLPGSRAEAQAIQRQLGANARLRLGAEALEDALRTQQPPRILHLATHGFFLADQDLKALADVRGFVVFDGERPAAPRPEAGQKNFENPLCRSGIALAGANVSLRGEGTEGVMTAEKILSLQLNGTELVALSACQTGLGDVKNGEGVFGLRRAILQTGAKGLVMSMWSVPDAETLELMRAFYANMDKGLPKAQALRQAALAEREIATKRHGQDNPFFWAAFVYLGER